VPLGCATLGRTEDGRVLFGLNDAGRYLLGAADDFELAPEWRAQLTEAAHRLLERLGFGAWDPRIGRAIFSSDSAVPRRSPSE